MYGRTLRNLLRPPPVLVKARIARASYGLRIRLPWDGSRHSRRDKTWHKHRLEWRATNQMRWLIVKVRCTKVNHVYFRSH